MRVLIYIILLLMVGCTTDTTNNTSVVPEGEPVEMLLNFGAESPITVTTRQTMPALSDEAKIWNLYIFIFDADGNKIYGRYFDGEQALASANAVANSSEDAWYVAVPEGDSQECYGTVKIHTVSKSGCKIFGITNIDTTMVNISPETLGQIQTQDELLSRVISLNQEFVERSGYFPMTGELSPVNTAALSGTLQLTRIDAKVRFWVKCGNEDIEEFRLNSWQIFNVSSDAYLMSRQVRSNYGYPTTDSALSYFNTEAMSSEEEEVYDAGDTTTTDDDKVRYGFSFYMLENSLQPKQSPAVYADRERQTKNSDGTNGSWEFANDYSTYVVLTGRIVMNTDYELGSEISKEGCTLNADVKYIIHLGDFTNSGPADFSTERNVSYTYNITVNGVNDIQVEVESSNDDIEGVTENAPGATGNVTIALHEVFDCDAHYESLVMEFDQQYIKPENITWYVRTPFGEGKPTNINGTDVTTGLDFKWIEFRVNEKWNNIYSKQRVDYIPHSTKLDSDGNPYPAADGKTMYVDELVKYLRDQKTEYDNGEANDFDGNGKLVITAFVNEFYYDEHPITGIASPLLWKRIVNHPQMRLMHILSDTQQSLDGESSVVGSSFTIQQHPIATVYNEKYPDLQTAWGCEHFDEYSALTYNAVGTGVAENRGNSDQYNGRLNTLKEWGVLNSDNTLMSGVRWDKYLNLNATNEESLLRDGTDGDANYKYLQYSCMSRNRDNNGDGVINPSEVRWYMASIKQLVGLWMGADGIHNTARLYKRTASERASNDQSMWRQHVVSSTKYGSNSNNPTIIWAEEGSSIGDLSGSTTWGDLTEWEVRCVRNLGMDDSDNADLTQTATDYVTVGGTDAVPVFNLEYLNLKSLRYLGLPDTDLVYSDENSAQNRLYWQFEATAVDSPTFSSINFADMNANLNSSISNNPYCPKGYRLPNQRELTIMHFYCASSFWSGVSQAYSRTYYSYGRAGSNPKSTEQQKTGWSRDGSNVYMESSYSNSQHYSTAVRCVRDVEIDN